MKDDAAPGKRLGALGTNVLIKPAKWQVSPVNEMGLDSEPVENTCEFYCNIASAIDQNTVWPCRKIKRLV